MAAQMRMHQQMHQYAVAHHFAQAQQAQQQQQQQQQHARGSGVVNGPPHGHGAFYGAPGGGANDAATRGARPGGGAAADAHPPTRATHRGVAPHGASAMDHAAASYEQMMAYQYGVERSRTFEAFKRAREGGGLNPGPRAPPSRRTTSRRRGSRATPSRGLPWVLPRTWARPCTAVSARRRTRRR